MSIVFHCIHCGAVFAAPDQLAGRRARCQGCRTAVEVPFASVPIASLVGQPALTPLGAANSTMLVPVQPQLELLRPDDPLKELLGPRTYQHRTGLPTTWIVGGGAGLLCVVSLLILIVWSMGSGGSNTTSVALAPAAGGFIQEPSGPRTSIPPAHFSQHRPTPSPGWAPPQANPAEDPFQQIAPPTTFARRTPTPTGGNGPASSSGSGDEGSSGGSASPGVALGPTTPAPAAPVLEPQASLSWAVHPDPSPLPLELKESSFKIPLSGPNPQIIFPAEASRFVLAWSGDNSRPECTMYDLKIGLAVGKKVTLFGLAPDKALVSVDGQYVAMPRVDEGSQQHRVRIAAVSFVTGEAQPRIELKCGAFHKVLFAGPQQLVTAHAVGPRFGGHQTHVISLWEVASGKLIREIDLNQLDVSQGAELKHLTISPGGKFAAYPVQDELIFIDLTTGQVVGRAPLSDEARGQARLCFSPDGKLLASIEGSSFRSDLRVIDVATGNLTVDERIEARSLGFSSQGPEISWLPENRGLLLGGQVLLELTSAREAYNLQRSRGEPRRIYRDGEVITLAADRNRYYLYSAPLPQTQIATVFDALRVRRRTAEEGAPPAETP